MESARNPRPAHAESEAAVRFLEVTVDVTTNRAGRRVRRARAPRSGRGRRQADRHVVRGPVARRARPVQWYRDGLPVLRAARGVHTRLPSLLDTERLRGLLARWLPLDSLHQNIDDGRIGAVAVTTTSTATGSTVVFVEKNPSIALPPPDIGRNITYVETWLTVDHVLASAAVPLLFRPIQVREPERWRGWYVDGGLRLNAPLVPAIAFGCERLGVVATQPMTSAASPPPSARRRTLGEPASDRAQPDVYAVAALTMRVLLADRMIEDLHRLADHAPSASGLPVLRSCVHTRSSAPRSNPCAAATVRRSGDARRRKRMALIVDARSLHTMGNVHGPAPDRPAGSGPVSPGTQALSSPDLRPRLQPGEDVLDPDTWAGRIPHTGGSLRACASAGTNGSTYSGCCP
ncbi:patatin-like phospholipase family protein [Prescottella defluvii]|nr:patatin-like phospholipase family protein [Prescottella defluvii]